MCALDVANTIRHTTFAIISKRIGKTWIILPTKLLRPTQITNAIYLIELFSGFDWIYAHQQMNRLNLYFSERLWNKIQIAIARSLTFSIIIRSECIKEFHSCVLSKNLRIYSWFQWFVAFLELCVYEKLQTDNLWWPISKMRPKLLRA